MKIAVIGVTGMVGEIMLQILQQRNFPVTELFPVASERSIGKTIEFKEEPIKIISIEEALEKQPDFAFFSAGGKISLEWAPKFAEAGTIVIDNSSAWRLDPAIKLIVPEVNGKTLSSADRIIANPNCSTIQLVMALKPLHRRYKIKRVIVSTYQSVSGSGMAGIEQLQNEQQDIKSKMLYPYPIHQNAIPHCDEFEENGYTKEEMKLTRETKKILGDDSIQVVATAVRVPVIGGHSESVNIEFEKDFDLSEVRQMLHAFPGVTLRDSPELNTYPMPIFAKDRDEVFVGRIRRDFTRENALNMWIVSDNLRKGAATNSIQIAEFLIKQKKEASFTKLNLRR